MEVDDIIQYHDMGAGGETWEAQAASLLMPARLGLSAPRRKRTLVQIVVPHHKPLTMDEFTCLG